MMAMKAPMIPPTDATALTPAPVNDIGLLLEGAKTPVPLEATPAGPAAPVGKGAAVVAGTVKLTTAAALDLACGAADVTLAAVEAR